MGSPTRAIEAAFQDAVVEFAVLNDLEVALPNVPYSRKTGTPYVKADFSPGIPSQAEMGQFGSNFHVGVFQATLFYPEGIGMVAPGEMADDLVDHFKSRTTISTGLVSIHITRSYAGRALIEPGWLYIPITVQYYCYSDN